MIDIEARRRGDAEMERLKQLLDDNSIEWEERGEGTPVVSFKRGASNCYAFPSQTYDGKMCVRYEAKAWVDTADEALKLCGVVE